MSAMASQITSLTVVYSSVYSGPDQRKHQSSASLAFVMGIHRWSVNSQHRGRVAWKKFPFDDVIMKDSYCTVIAAKTYRQLSNTSRTLVGNKIVDRSDVFGAPHVGAAPTTSSLST